MKKYPNILNESFENKFWNGSGGSEESIYKIHFITKDNKLILEAVEIGRYSGSNYSGEGTIFEKGEVISNAIKKHNIENNVEYILVENYGYRSWVHQPESQWSKMVVYKKGEDF